MVRWPVFLGTSPAGEAGSRLGGVPVSLLQNIGDCCIAGLGAVVTRGSVESNWLIGGVPARPLRQLKTDDYELVFAKTRPDLPDQALEDERNPFFKRVAHSVTGG